MTDILIIGKKPQMCGPGVTWIDCDANALLSESAPEIADFHIVIFWPTERIFAPPEREDARKWMARVPLKWQAPPVSRPVSSSKTELRSEWVVKPIDAKSVFAEPSIESPHWIRYRCYDQLESLLEATTRGVYLFVIVPEGIANTAFAWLELNWDFIPRPPKIVKIPPPLFVNPMQPVLNQFTTSRWWISFILEESGRDGFSPFHFDHKGRTLSVIRQTADGGVAVLPAPDSLDVLLKWIGEMKLRNERGAEAPSSPTGQCGRLGYSLSSLLPKKIEREATGRPIKLDEVLKLCRALQQARTFQEFRSSLPPSKMGRHVDIESIKKKLRRWQTRPDLNDFAAAALRHIASMEAKAAE